MPMTMMRPLIAALFSLAVAAVPPAWAQSTLAAYVDSIAAEHLDEGRIAGMAVGVVHGPDTLVLEGYGFADLEWDVPMPADAIFEIGSVTKQFTSVAILQLWQQGKVDLDADLKTYLPEYDTQGRTIAVRRLLDHTSGIKGYTEMPDFARLVPRALARDSLVALFEAEPLEFEPGHALIYNNSAYFLLGLIIEAVSGQEYDAYLEEHVFPLAGMDDTSYCTNNEVWKGRAHGYSPGPDGLERAAYLDHTWPYSAGSLCSTVGDLVSWNRALHGGEVLSPEAYQAMTTPAPLADGTPTRYAMGITQYQSRSGRVIAHGGGIFGFLSTSRYYPDEDATVVVLMNTAGPPGPDVVADAVAGYLFGDDHLPPAQAFTGSLDPFEGRYSGPGRGRTLNVTISSEGGGLVLDMGMGPPMTLEFLEGSTFFNGTMRVVFEREDDRFGRVRIDQVGGHYVLTRTDEGGETRD